MKLQLANKSKCYFPNLRTLTFGLNVRQGHKCFCSPTNTKCLALQPQRFVDNKCVYHACFLRNYSAFLSVSSYFAFLPVSFILLFRNHVQFLCRIIVFFLLVLQMLIPKQFIFTLMFKRVVWVILRLYLLYHTEMVLLIIYEKSQKC